jgi:methionyl-tRNA synthetase
MNERYYITTPIFYVNGTPHVGHAYSAIAADVLARWHRLDGDDVFFLTGTDEYGQKVEQTARDLGIDPQDLADRNAAEFQDVARRLNITNDDFIRTTQPRHHATCAALWNKLFDAGEIYLGEYSGWYSMRDEAFYAEDELLERDGTRVSPFGSPVALVKEPNYLFRLSQWQDRLLAFYDANPDFLGPSSSRSEVLSFVRGGLTDLSVSRTNFRWGVPVPNDPAHVMYVWLDALTNYLTAIGWPDADAPRAAYWPANLHLVGKEIVRFHAVYWPAFLMAAGIPVPRRVFAGGWWTVEGEKMSKSVGNVIDPRVLVDEFGLDALRFFLLREMPFGNDGDFNRRALIGRMNSELANDLGNLAQRTLSLIAKNCGGVLPAVGRSTDDDADLRAQAAALPGLIRASLDRQAFHEALEETWKVIRAANSYIDRQAPWALRKTDLPRMEAVLRVLADVIRGVATVLQPFMPTAMAAMLDQSGVPEDGRTLAALNTSLPAGFTLPPPQGVFPRFIETVA